jgi:hypothetical protein
MQIFKTTCSIIYCKDNIKCDSASHAPKCPLNNDVSIVQKHVVKLSKQFLAYLDVEELVVVVFG